MTNKLLVHRWTKGQHDRLYVSTSNGTKIGWLDLISGEEQLKYPGMGLEFNAALERWKTTHPQWWTVPRQPTSRSIADVDIAQRKAGENPARTGERLRTSNPFLRALAWFGTRAIGTHTADWSWRVGAAGEVKVGRRLDRLRRHGWYVLHSIPLPGGGDIDHLLIGPPGVFTINTKHHKRIRVKVGNTVAWVGRTRVSYVQRSRTEARRVKQHLAPATEQWVNVRAVVVVLSTFRVRGWIRNQPQGVRFLPHWAVPWWFRRFSGRPTLNEHDMTNLYALARRAGTWR